MVAEAGGVVTELPGPVGLTAAIDLARAEAGAPEIDLHPAHHRAHRVERGLAVRVRPPGAHRLQAELAAQRPPAGLDGVRVQESRRGQHQLDPLLRQRLGVLERGEVAGILAEGLGAHGPAHDLGAPRLRERADEDHRQHRVVADQTFEHRLVNDPDSGLFVSADWVQSEGNRKTTGQYVAEAMATSEELAAVIALAR